MSRRRTRWIGIAAVVAAAIAALVAWSVAGGGTHAAGGRTGSTRTTMAHRPVATLPPLVPTVGGASVSTTVLPFVDLSRPVVSGGRMVAPDRSLPTDVWSPVGGGPYPLVVFVHGYDIGPSTYEQFCSTLAASGYVVAAPSFPLEDPARGLGLDRTELPSEAADVSFVITSIEHGAFAPRIEPSRIAVVGHSDGADVALMVGYEHGTVDPRVRAVVADAPDPITAPVVSTSTPLLLVQGTADSVVPYSSSQTVFTQVHAPVDYLSLLGADHLGPIAGGTVWTPVLDAAVARLSGGGGRGPRPERDGAHAGARRISAREAPDRGLSAPRPVLARGDRRP